LQPGENIRTIFDFDKIYSQIQFSPTFAFENERMCFFSETQNLFAESRKQPTYIDIYIYILGHHEGDLMERMSTAAAACSLW
jgi:hypothetical protein